MIKTWDRDWSRAAHVVAANNAVTEQNAFGCLETGRNGANRPSLPRNTPVRSKLAFRCHKRHQNGENRYSVALKHAVTEQIGPRCLEIRQYGENRPSLCLETCRNGASWAFLSRSTVFRHLYAFVASKHDIGQLVDLRCFGTRRNGRNRPSLGSKHAAADELQPCCPV